MKRLVGDDVNKTGEDGADNKTDSADKGLESNTSKPGSEEQVEGGVITGVSEDASNGGGENAAILIPVKEEPAPTTHPPELPHSTTDPPLCKPLVLQTLTVEATKSDTHLPGFPTSEEREGQVYRQLHCYVGQLQDDEGPNTSKLKFVMDTGASDDMCNPKHFVPGTQEAISGWKLNGFGPKAFDIDCKGSVLIHGTRGDFLMKDVLGSEHIKENLVLVSIPKRDKLGYHAIPGGGKMLLLTDQWKLGKKIKAKHITLQASLHKQANLYFVDTASATTICSYLARTYSTTEKFDLWHQRSMHTLDQDALREQSGMKDGVLSPCPFCIRAKITRDNIYKGTADKKSSTPGWKIGLDVISNKTATPEGFKTGLWAVDEASNVWRAILCKSKREVMDAVRDVVAFFEKSTGTRCGVIRCDMDSMFFPSSDMRDFCRTMEIKLEVAPGGRQDMNGLAERNWRSAIEACTANMLTCSCPYAYCIFIVRSPWK